MNLKLQQKFTCYHMKITLNYTGPPLPQLGCQGLATEMEATKSGSTIQGVGGLQDLFLIHQSTCFLDQLALGSPPPPLLRPKFLCLIQLTFFPLSSLMIYFLLSTSMRGSFRQGSWLFVLFSYGSFSLVTHQNQE